MTTVFADTSFFIALLNPRDDDHLEANRFMIEPGFRMITSAWVVTELANHFAQRGDRRLAMMLVEQLNRSRRCTVLPARDIDFRAGWALYVDRPDKDWSLTDCISFTQMKQRRVTTALSADQHFIQAGFRALLVESRRR